MPKQTFTIIRIMDEYTVIIDGGKNDNLELGNILQISEPSEPLINPLTSEIIGYLDQIKAHVKIFAIYDTFSICKSNETYSVDMNAGMFALFAASTRDTIKPLKVEPSEVTPLTKSDDPIRIGDKAHRI